MNTACKRGCIFIVMILMALVFTQMNYLNMARPTTPSVPTPVMAIKVGVGSGHMTETRLSGRVSHKG